LPPPAAVKGKADDGKAAPRHMEPTGSPRVMDRTARGSGAAKACTNQAQSLQGTWRREEEDGPVRLKLGLLTCAAYLFWYFQVFGFP